MTLTEIKTKLDYQYVQNEVEAYLQKATEASGFARLSEDDDRELLRLSHLMRTYEQEHFPVH